MTAEYTHDDLQGAIKEFSAVEVAPGRWAAKNLIELHCYAIVTTDDLVELYCAEDPSGDSCVEMPSWWNPEQRFAWRYESTYFTTPILCEVLFERIGRQRDPLPLKLWLDSDNADDLAKAVWKYSSTFLQSRAFEVDVNLELQTGLIEGGRFGRFSFSLSVGETVLRTFENAGAVRVTADLNTGEEIAA